MTISENELRQALRLLDQQMPVDDDLVEPTLARVHGDRRKRLATVGGVLCAALLVGGAWVLETQGPTASHVASGDRTAGELAGERLGLEPVEFPAPDCDIYVGYEPGLGYCLDGVTGDETELVLISQEILGYEMTDARIAYVKALVELKGSGFGDGPADDAKVQELEAIVNSTQGDLDPLYEPKSLGDYPGLTGQALADAAGVLPAKGILYIGCEYIIEVEGQFSYCIEGLGATPAEQEEWASLLSGRNLRSAEMPDVEGLTEAEAVAAVEASGLEARIKRDYTDDVPEGYVFFQWPKPGASQHVTFPVEIGVSKGDPPPPVAPTTPPLEMPDLVGLDLDQAKQEIADLGLHLSMISWIEGHDGPRGQVLNQVPDAGETTYEGRAVQIRVIQ